MYAIETCMTVFIFKTLHRLRRAMSGALLRTHLHLTLMLVFQVRESYRRSTGLVHLPSALHVSSTRSFLHRLLDGKHRGSIPKHG